MGIFYVDGKFVDEKSAVLSANDMAVLRGYGIFDFMRTYNKRPFCLKEHIDRLYNSGSHVGLIPPCSKEELFDIVMETLERNDYGESNVRIVYTGGISPDSVTPAGNGTLMVMVTPKHELPAWWYEKGVKVVTANVDRYIPEAKSTNYMNAVLTQQIARSSNAVESLYVDIRGRVLEGTTTNIFLFSDGKWITPGEGILPGVTRAVVMDLIKNEYGLEVRDITREDLEKADEVLITASNKEIVPVVQVDEVMIGGGVPGNNTRRIMELFREYTCAYGRDKVPAAAS